MKLKRSEKADKALGDLVRRARRAGADVTDFLRGSVGGLSIHWAAMPLSLDFDVSEIWDLHVDPFEAGLRIGASLEKGDVLWVLNLSDDDVAPEIHLGAMWSFWIQALDEDALVESLSKATIDHLGALLEKQSFSKGL